jgi:hypothetical protein
MAHPVLFLLVGIVLAQTSQNSCPNVPYLSSYGLVAGSFSQTPIVCNSVYSQWGTCLNQTNTTVNLRNVTSTFRFNSLNAYQFVHLLTNMTTYWKAVNGYINGPIGNNNTISNAMSQTWNSDRNWTAETPLWLLQAQRAGMDAIQPCTEAYANISIGVWCSVTSAHPLDSAPTTTGQTNMFPFTFPTSSQEIGSKLESCLPLLDVYCMNSYGISVRNSALPFNTTFNFSDETIPLSVCLAAQNVANATDAAGVATRQGLLIGLFNTIRIPYVPTYDGLRTLAFFLQAGKTNTTWAPSNRTLSISPGARINYNPTAENLTFYTYGTNSNITGYRYGDAGTGIFRVFVAAALWLILF